jgi:hypothetical protein
MNMPEQEVKKEEVKKCHCVHDNCEEEVKESSILFCHEHYKRYCTGAGW